MLRPDNVDLKGYLYATKGIRENAQRCRDEFNTFLATGNNAMYHKRYTEAFDELIEKHGHLSEAERNHFVHDLLKSDQWGFPHSFMEQMMQIMNEMAFWIEREQEWECDEESVKRREEGKLPHWVVQIDDSAPGHERNNPLLSRRKSLILN